MMDGWLGWWVGGRKDRWIVDGLMDGTVDAQRDER